MFYQIIIIVFTSGKTLAHEWAHLRYGVFDETLEGTDNPSCLLHGKNTTLPVKCSQNVQGQTTIAEDQKSCQFIASLYQPPGVKASLMYLPYLDTVGSLCIFIIF